MINRDEFTHPCNYDGTTIDTNIGRYTIVSTSSITFTIDATGTSSLIRNRTEYDYYAIDGKGFYNRQEFLDYNSRLLGDASIYALSLNYNEYPIKKQYKIFKHPRNGLSPGQKNKWKRKLHLKKLGFSIC